MLLTSSQEKYPPTVSRIGCLNHLQLFIFDQTGRIKITPAEVKKRNSENSFTFLLGIFILKTRRIIVLVPELTIFFLKSGLSSRQIAPFWEHLILSGRDGVWVGCWFFEKLLDKLKAKLAWMLRLRWQNCPTVYCVRQNDNQFQFLTAKSLKTEIPGNLYNFS